MKEIIRDGEKFYELSEQELIELRNRLMHIYMRVDDIFADRAVMASLTDIKDNVTEARGILRVTEGRYTFNKSSVEMSEEEWQKIRGGAMSYGDVEQRLETVKSSLEDAISDVDCNLSDRIDELGEKIAEMYDFYDNFPADWTLEKQLKELAEDTVKTAVEPIVKRQALLNMNIEDLRRDLKLWVANDERTSTETDDRLTKLEKKVIILTANNTDLDRHEEDIDQIISRLDKLDMDMKQRIEENRIHADACKSLEERFKLLSKNVASIYDEVASIKDNATTALAADNATLARHEKEIAQLEKQMNNAITDIALLRKAFAYYKL